MSGETMNEIELDYAFIQAIPYSLPHVMAFRRQIINVEAKQGFRARAGVRGQADIYVIVAGGGHVEIETKMPRRQLRVAQEAWKARCEAMRVPYLCLRANAGEAPEATVARWVEELRKVVGEP